MIKATHIHKQYRTTTQDTKFTTINSLLDSMTKKVLLQYLISFIHKRLSPTVPPSTPSCNFIQLIVFLPMMSVPPGKAISMNFIHSITRGEGVGLFGMRKL